MELARTSQVSSYSALIAGAAWAQVKWRFNVARKTRMEKFPIGPVLEYLGQQMPGGRRSGRVKAKCSFHDDTVASAVIDYVSNRFRCFACGETGDAIELLMRHEGINFAAAVERGEEITGQAQSAVRGKRESSGGLFDDTGIF